VTEPELKRSKNSTEESVTSTLPWTKLIRYEFGGTLFATDDDLLNWGTEIRMRMRDISTKDISDAIRWASDINWKCKEMTLKMLRTIIFCHRKHKVEESELTEGGEQCPWCHHGWLDFTKPNGAIHQIPCLCPTGVHVEAIAYKEQPKGQFKELAKKALKQVQKKEQEAIEWASKHPHVSTQTLAKAVATPFS